MKKLLKIFLPPFIGFLVFSVAINRNVFNIVQKLDETGLSEIKNLTNFYRFTLPLLYVIAVLTQLLVINPVWRMLRRKTAADRVNLIVAVPHDGSRPAPGYRNVAEGCRAGQLINRHEPIRDVGIRRPAATIDMNQGRLRPAAKRGVRIV